jgi:hypothetical protein
MSVRQSVRAAVVAVALVVATTGCTGGQESASGPPAPTAAPSSGPSVAPSAAPSTAPAPSAAPSEPAAAGEVPLLEGRVGTEEDPEAFELVLTDSSGAPVEDLPAGDYDIRVQDPSTLHNFHLTGPGVDETTPVPGTGEVVWRVTLAAGEYTAVCDPHPDMVATFSVS